MNHINLDDILLSKGSHLSRNKGVCVMEAVAWFAGEPHSDQPKCTDAVVAAYARQLNDRMPDNQRQRLKEYIPLLAGTKNGATPQQRAFLCADRAVRVFAAMALRAHGQVADADKLAALPAIVDRETALAATAYAAYVTSAAITTAITVAAAITADDAITAEAAAGAAADAITSAAANAADADAAAYAVAWDAAIELLRDLCAMGAK